MDRDGHGGSKDSLLSNEQQSIVGNDGSDINSDQVPNTLAPATRTYKLFKSFLVANVFTFMVSHVGECVYSFFKNRLTQFVQHGR